MTQTLYNGLEITLETSKNGEVLSFRNMDSAKLKKLNTVLSKLIETDNPIADFEITLEEGSWKIILFSSILSTINLTPSLNGQLKSFTNYINSNFDEKRIVSFHSTDKINRVWSSDVTSEFTAVRSTRRRTIDNIVVIPDVEINDINLKEVITFTSGDSIKRLRLKNGLSLHFDKYTYAQLKRIHSDNYHLCIIENSSKYSGIVGVFSNEVRKEYYVDKYFEILESYNSLIEADSPNTIQLVSNSIIDTFENQYGQLFGNPNLNEELMEVHSFMSLFINRNFDKQVHLNILAYLSFIKDSPITLSLKDTIRQLYFPS